MHLPVNGPKLTPSQDSPVSIAKLPHLGFSVHEEVSSWQFVHFRVPPEKDKLYFAHVSIEPNFVPSHASPMFMIPSPQMPCTPWHFEVSSLQLLQVIFPSENVEGLYSMQPPLNGPRLTPSQDSPVSIAALPHLGFSVQLDVSSWHTEEHFRVPPLNEEL